jgi:hypothetical protein
MNDMNNDERKIKSTIQEQFATLYLRLNGYFTTGYIIHSTKNGDNKGEIDIIAVRFPLHRQDTGKESSKFLELSPDIIDIIVGEVKNTVRPFNGCLTQQEPWGKILNWIGILPEKEIIETAEELKSLVTDKNADVQTFRSTKVIKTDFGKVKIRPIRFVFKNEGVNENGKFIDWTEMNDFIWGCLCPAKKRESCATRYNFAMWGQGLDKIVLAYKNRKKEKFKNFEELYGYMKALENKKSRNHE